MTNNSILFICRDISYHQKKILDIILSETKNLIILCSDKDGIPLKYKSYMHPYFSKIARYTFTNWTLIFIAPILVFLDSLLFKRNIVIGHYILTFGWAISFAVKSQKLILAMGSDLLINPYKNFIKRIVIKFALRRADKLLVDNLQGYFNSFTLGFNGHQILLSPYGVEINKLSTNIFKREKIPIETILWIRGTYPVYNIDCFIEALKILEKKERKRWLAIIAGKGSNDKKFIEKINSLDFKEKIRIVGYIKDERKMKELFEQSSIYVSSSNSDGTSVALLEAMAYGLTIVVSNITNNKQWIKHSKSGFLFDPQNASELAEILSNLINHKISIKKRKAMAKESHNYVKKFGSIEIFQKSIKKMLNRETK